MSHLLASALSTWQSGVRWHKADAFHLAGPFTIMITASGWGGGTKLPEMNHFMDKCAENFRIRATFHGFRIQTDLRNTRRLNLVGCSQGKALVVVVSPNIDGTMIQGDQDWRQMPVEKQAIEVVESIRQASILAPGRLAY
jgi:hypothetical protein